MRNHHCSYSRKETSQLVVSGDVFGVKEIEMKTLRMVPDLAYGCLILKSKNLICQGDR